jgi:excisionase family DNA binding protein
LTEEGRDAADPWLTLAEIAEELRVNPATVRQWVTKGQLKAARAGVRKWIVRRSELERMLAATNVAPETVAVKPDAGRAAGDERRRGRDQAETSAADAQSAIALLQIANQRFAEAVEASAFVPPAPGYVGRLRRLADSCEHMASTLLNAANLAGVRWSPRTDFGLDAFPYEVRAGGNRPAGNEVWSEVDAALDRLLLAVTGTEMSAVAYSFRELGDTLLEIADQLESDDSWQVGSRAG